VKIAVGALALALVQTSTVPTIDVTLDGGTSMPVAVSPAA
jgi:hypothetical protein